NKEYLHSINFSEKSFKDYIKEKSVIVYATDKKSGEITLTRKSAEFAREIDDLYFVDDNGVHEIFDKILGSNDYGIVDCGKNRFIRFEYENKDKGGVFSGFQLITVKNGELYAINYTVSGNDIIDENIKLSLISSFEYTGDTELGKVGADTVITIIILILAILVFVGIAAYIVYTFYKDIKARKDENDVAPYVKIKRRKF
ncbi:MAG: hypothetical protein KBS52_02125, partial [Clostridiales bacterium]|nr:hypothetical protein [Candidatus Equinaster intestinalis]